MGTVLCQSTRYRIPVAVLFMFHSYGHVKKNFIDVIIAAHQWIFLFFVLPCVNSSICDIGLACNLRWGVSFCNRVGHRRDIL